MGDKNALELFGFPRPGGSLLRIDSWLLPLPPCAFISTENKHQGASPLNWVLNLEFILLLFNADSTFKHNENYFIQV